MGGWTSTKKKLPSQEKSATAPSPKNSHRQPTTDTPEIFRENVKSFVERRLQDIFPPKESKCVDLEHAPFVTFGSARRRALPVWNGRTKEYEGVLDCRDIIKHAIAKHIKMLKQKEAEDTMPLGSSGQSPSFGKKQRLGDEYDEAIYAGMNLRASSSEDADTEILYLARMRPFPTLKPTDQVLDALDYLSHNSHVVGIQNKSQEIQINRLLDQDEIFQSIVSNCAGKKFKLKEIKDCWKDNVVVSFDVDQTLYDAFEHLNKTGHSSVLISQNGNPHSVISSVDIHVWLQDQDCLSNQISDFLQSRSDDVKVINCSENDSLESAVTQMISSKSHRVFIKSGRQHACFSMTDFFRFINDNAGAKRASFHATPRKSSQSQESSEFSAEEIGKYHMKGKRPSFERLQVRNPSSENRPASASYNADTQGTSYLEHLAFHTIHEGNEEHEEEPQTWE